jgi:hypothetical protein
MQADLTPLAADAGILVFIAFPLLSESWNRRRDDVGERERDDPAHTLVFRIQGPARSIDQRDELATFDLDTLEADVARTFAFRFVHELVGPLNQVRRKAARDEAPFCDTSKR